MAEGDSGNSESQNEKKDDPHDLHDQLQELQDMTLNPDINIETLVDEATHEYENLDKTLDEIDSWMTTIESRNDSLYSQLQDLLKSSKETRQELQMMNETKGANSNKHEEDSGTGDKNMDTNS